MSDQPDQAAAMRHAINNRDINGIATAYNNLRNTDIDTLLEQLATAIDEGRYEDANTTFQEILNTYQDKRDIENERSAQITAARTSRDSSLESVQELTTYLREANNTRVQRAELVATVSSFLKEKLEENNDSGSDSNEVQSYTSSNVLSVVSQTRDKEIEFSQVSESAEATASDVTLSPTLKILQISTETTPITTGETVDLNVNIKNVGDDSATDIAISAETSEAIDVDDSEISISSLSAGESVSKIFTITANTQGLHSITISAEGQESATSQTEEITATTDTSIPEPYSAYVDNDGYVTPSGLNDAIGAYLRDNLGSTEINRIIGAYLSESKVTS